MTGCSDALEQFLMRMLMMPTAILIEDTHWLDDASQLVLAKLAQPGPRPWLVVATRRPSGMPLGAGTVVELEPLGEADARSLALAAAGDASLSEAELEALTARAAGNPLFLRELAVAPSDTEALPETVELLLTSRIDTLHPSDKLLLRHASVIGRTFALDLLEEIVPEEVGDAEQWTRLADFVEWAGPDHLTFRHDLVRDAAYDGLSFTRRTEIHAAVGAALERRSPDPELDAEVLSLHFLAANEWEKAWRYAVLAGDDARSKYANIDAGTFYERALAAAGGLEADPGELARVCEALGDVRELAARYDDADSAYASALEHGGPCAQLVRKRGIVAERQGRYEDALDLYDEAAPHADAAESVQLQLGRAIVLYRQGRIDDSADAAALAAEEATALNDRRGLADAYYIRAAAEGDRGGPARDFLEQALPIFEELGVLHRQATVLNNMAVRAFYDGDWGRAIEFYSRSEEVARRAGDVLTTGHTSTNRGELLLHRGQLEEAHELLETALRIYRAATFRIGEALVLGYLGHLAAEQGRFADAHQLFDEASRQLTELGSKSFLIEADARRAQAFALEGRHVEATALAADCLERMKETGETGTRAALLERLLAVAAVQGRRRDEAPPHFAESLRLGREAGADYEVARTLQVMAMTGFATDEEVAEAEEIMDRLGVVSFPDVPLP